MIALTGNKFKIPSRPKTANKNNQNKYIIPVNENVRA